MPARSLPQRPPDSRDTVRSRGATCSRTSRGVTLALTSGCACGRGRAVRSECCRWLGGCAHLDQAIKVERPSISCVIWTHLEVEQLARISHQLPVASADAPHPAVFSRFGVLDVLRVRAPRPSGRKPHWARRLVTLATKAGEICGLGCGITSAPAAVICGRLN
jgi:hypothetical protein